MHLNLSPQFANGRIIYPERIAFSPDAAADVPVRARSLPSFRPAQAARLMAWILLFSGASATPREVTFTCGRCGEVIEHTRDTTITREFLNQ